VRRLWDIPGQNIGPVLCQLYQLAPSLATMSPSVVWGLLYPPPAGQVLPVQTN
jgi:hypothetical protein